MTPDQRKAPDVPMGTSFLLAPEVQKARDLLLDRDEWILERQKELTAIPAPPFGEGPRAEQMMSLFREAGLEEVRRDEVGNVLASRFRESREPSPLIISAHLDTVFPPETEIAPRVAGERILAPGISDDGRGLAALLALAWIMEATPLPPLPPLLFVATVGEEGAGNLRGVRHLFRNGGPGKEASGFISLDGVGLDRIINAGVGSTRLRVTLTGPGGHSWTDWGMPNPLHVLGRMVGETDRLPLPSIPRTTATVARWGGGRSINAIPQEGWLEVDLRSQDQGELRRLEESFLQICRQECRRDERRIESDLTLAVKEIGRRPAGATGPEEPLVLAAVAATEELGVEARLTASSTDANLPMSLGIPAITLGAGGRAGGIHTLNEWYSNEEGPEGILRALLTLLHLGS